MKRWWLGWYGPAKEFEYHGPWWISGYRMDDACTPTFVAAALAETEEEAKAVIADSYDREVDIEWRFAHEKHDQWEPFCDRFPRGDWMLWPTPKKPEAQP